jgi:hypothetical protein
MVTHNPDTRSRWSQSEPGAEEVIQRFFDRFARAVTTGDGRSIARMWAVPALVVGDSMVQAVGSLDQVEEFFGGAKEQYNAQGIADTRAELQRVEWLTRRLAVVDVRWPYLDAQGVERGEETSTYVLRRDDSGELKLQAALMRGAKR